MHPGGGQFRFFPDNTAISIELAEGGCDIAQVGSDPVRFAGSGCSLNSVGEGEQDLNEVDFGWVSEEG